MLDAAATLDFLKSPPGNHLEALTGNLAGLSQYSHQHLNGVFALLGQHAGRVFAQGLKLWITTESVKTMSKPTACALSILVEILQGQNF